MKTILVLGAGLSASSLFRYLISHLEDEDWTLRIANINVKSLENKFGNNPKIKLIELDASNEEDRRACIAHVDLVISMLPPSFHYDVAHDCIELKTDLITPSYVSDEMKSLHDKAVQREVTIVNEMGVDPGIDHMSAMKIIDKINKKGGKIKSFKSFCGGLIAPEFDDNSWHYRFTWNPRNVVLAGQGGAAAFRQHKELKYIPYSQLFKRTERFSIDGFGDFDGYANRDSLKYLEIYGIEDVETIYRGTLRRPNFCQGWDVFVELGLTDDRYVLNNSKTLTPRQLLNAFLPYVKDISVEDKLKRFLREDRLHLFPLFEEIGFFSNDVCLSSKDGSPAILLQELLLNSWYLKPEHKDMIVMYHEFEYEINSQLKKIKSSMVALGEDSIFTAMSNTVGLPIAIMARRILNGYKNPGVHIPVMEEIYSPVLAELEKYGITFNEEETEIN